MADDRAIVDVAYAGEFTQIREPLSAGADVIAGSFIKNPGGGITPTGGYIAGKADLVEKISHRFTAPGIGKDLGCTQDSLRDTFLGFYYAPGVVCEALKTAVYAQCLLELVGVNPVPRYTADHNDIVTCFDSGSAAALQGFCAGIQSCSPVDSFVSPGDIAVAEFDENDHLLPPRVVLKENFHLSFPTVFDWRGEVWMLPETSADHSLTLYRCTQFPDKWEKVQAFSVGRELCDSIIVDKTPEALTVLCSETRPDNQLYTRYRRYTVRENPEAEERDDVDEFILDEDEPFNLQHRNYELGSRNAGPLFTNNDQTVRPAQVSTKVDYGVYLQFWVRRGASEVPLCAAMPQNVAIAGIDPADLIGIHTYCRDADIEVIDARYLRKV